jgi:hypothetical protein
LNSRWLVALGFFETRRGRTCWIVLALPDEDLPVFAVHSFDYQRKTMGSLKRSNALFASLPPRSFTLNERLHFIISLKRST